MNHLILAGNLGKDPEMSYTPNGTPVTKFSIAIREYLGKDQNGNAKSGTLWVNCTCWQSLAETAAKYLTKGSKVTVSGRLSIRDYTSSQDGIKRQWVECVVSQMELPSKHQQSEEPVAEYGNIDLDEKPF